MMIEETVAYYFICIMTIYFTIPNIIKMISYQFLLWR